MVNAICVPPDRIHEFWTLAEDFIRNAVLKIGLCDFEVLQTDIHCGSALLWLAWDGKTVLAAAVTKVAAANGKKICTLIACGGRQREKWIFLKDKIEEYAREESCVRVEILGRRGWQRVLPDYRAPFVILTKEL